MWGALKALQTDFRAVLRVAGHEIQPDGPAQSIDDHGQFRVRATLGFTNGLSLDAASGVGGILMNLDLRAVHAAYLAAGIGREQREHLRPKSASAPATNLGLDRRPWTKLLGQISPRLPRSQDEGDTAVVQDVTTPVKTPKPNSSTGA